MIKLEGKSKVRHLKKISSIFIYCIWHLPKNGETNISVFELQLMLDFPSNLKGILSDSFSNYAVSSGNWMRALIMF